MKNTNSAQTKNEAGMISAISLWISLILKSNTNQAGKIFEPLLRPLLSVQRYDELWDRLYALLKFDEGAAQAYRDPGEYALSLHFCQGDAEDDSSKRSVMISISAEPDEKRERALWCTIVWTGIPFEPRPEEWKSISIAP